MACFPDDNYLFAEKILLDRLGDIVPAGTRVESLGDVRELVQGAAAFPCACLTYLGDQLVTRLQDGGDSVRSLGSGKVCQAVQQWAVIVGAKDASTPRTSMAARERAGKILLKVLKGLQGFEVATGRQLRRAPFAGASAVYIDGGHVFLTAQFNLTLDISGD
jgi:hypothetical protein